MDEEGLAGAVALGENLLAILESATQLVACHDVLTKAHFSVKLAPAYLVIYIAT
ncbi:MAG: hypothetical protein VW338_11090 [Rhodospirillaceae bacterium]